MERWVVGQRRRAKDKGEVLVGAKSLSQRRVVGGYEQQEVVATPSFHISSDGGVGGGGGGEVRGEGGLVVADTGCSRSHCHLSVSADCTCSRRYITSNSLSSCRCRAGKGVVIGVSRILREGWVQTALVTRKEQQIGKGGCKGHSSLVLSDGWDEIPVKKTTILVI